MQIVGKRVLLRDEVRETDYEDFFRWRNLEEWHYYDEPDKPLIPMPRAEFEIWRRRPKTITSTSHSWQIDALAKHIGWVNYYQLDEQAGYAYVGIVLPEPET